LNVELFFCICVGVDHSVDFKNTFKSLRRVDFYTLSDNTVKTSGSKKLVHF